MYQGTRSRIRRIPDEVHRKMKSKILMGVILLSTLILSGCFEEESKKLEPYDGGQYNDLKIYTYCSDRVVCYYHPNGYAGGMGCFRDDDLVVKYCN